MLGIMRRGAIRPEGGAPVAKHSREPRVSSSSQPVQRDATPCNNQILREILADRYLRNDSPLSPRQLNAVELLLQGLSDAEVAGQLGVDRTTIFRWRKIEEFQNELDRHRQVLWQQTVGQLQA